MSETIQDRTQRRIAQLVMGYYLLLILGGVLRKWVFPNAEEILFFINIPVVLAIYLLALNQRSWPRTNWMLGIAYGFAVLSLVLLPLQFALGAYSSRHLLIWGYGWYNYFFLIPLAFIVAEQFTEQDFLRLARITLWLSLPAAIIVVFQFWSLPTSLINQGGGREEINRFHNLGAALGFVRPQGFFTSTSGQKHFLASLTALLVGAWLLPQWQRLIGRTLLTLALIATVVMLAHSGSRGAFIHAGLILACGLAFGGISGNRSLMLRSILVASGLLLSFLGIASLLAEQGLEVIARRWDVAAMTENRIFELGIIGRIFYNFYGFIFYLFDTPLTGYLLGMGGNAAQQLPWVDLPAAASDWAGYGEWAEGGWDRHIIELGPVLGVLFILYRVIFFLALLRASLLRAVRWIDPWPGMLLAFAGLPLLNGQLGHGSTLGYTWLFVGLILSKLRQP